MFTGHALVTVFGRQREAGKVFDSPFGRAEVSHTCPNDGTAEGVRALDVPAFSVQYHPEAAAGPHDAANLFDQFVQLLTDPKGDR